MLAWLEEHAHRRSIEEIKRVLRWLSKHLRGKALADITDGTVRSLRAAKLSEPINRRSIALAQGAGKTPPAAKAPSAATINRHLAQLSAVLHYAHKRGWLPAVPPIAKAHEAVKRVTWLTHEQAETLLDELPDHLRCMASFAMATGLRESNVRLLTWQQVDMARAVAWYEADEMKAGRTHSVPLNDAAMAVLAAQQGMHKRWVFPVPRWEKKRSETAPARQVWDLPTGKISGPAWRKACVRAGVPTLRWHDLRHTWASWHVQAGTPLPVLQELGGWKSLTMVQRYAHLGHSHVSAWAGNIRPGGTTPAQLAAGGATEPAPHVGHSHRMGWLMGLEPTTTRITTRSTGIDLNEIKHLQAAPKRKAG